MKKLLTSIIIILLPLTLMAGPGMHGVGMGSGAGASDTTPPELSSATVGTDGTTLTLVFSEAVTQGVSYVDTDWDFNDGSDVGMVFDSGNTSDTWTFAVPTVHSGDTVTLDWAGTSNGVEDGAGNDLAAISARAVTNNSTQSACTGSYGNQLTTDAGVAGDATVQCFAKQITSACNGTSASVTVRLSYSDPTGNNGRYSLCIWADNAGEPGTLLGHVHGTQSTNSAAWITETLAQATGATTFWIGFYGESAIGIEYSSATGGTSRARYNCTNPWDAPPSTWDGPGSGTNDGDFVNHNFEAYITFP